MTYIELINHFWQEFENKGMKPNDALFYLYLINVSNRKSWKNPFYLPNKTVRIALDVSEKSIIDSRQRLSDRGLIRFTKGDRNCGSPGYYIPIIDIKDADSELLQNFNLKIESRNVDESYMNCSRNVDESYMKGVARIENHARKTKDIKTKDNISPNGDNAVAPSLFDEEEKKTKKRKPKAAKTPPVLPTFEEVRDYFLSQDADKRLEDWEESCRRFYDNFNAVEWRDKFNRRITRWDSRANSWILDDEKRQKEKSPHEVQNKSGGTEQSVPSGGVSIRGRVTPSCGLKRRDPKGEK